MVLRNKPTIMVYFMVFSVVAFIFIFLMTLALRDFLFQDLLAQSFQINIVQFMNLSIIYLLLYIIWDILLLFTITFILNVIIAKILNLEVGKIVLITLVALTIAIVSFHVVTYLWLLMGDPLKLGDKDLSEYLLELSTYYTITSSDISGISTIGFDLLLKIFYDSAFKTDKSVLNYLVMYILLKGFVSDVPFQMAGLSFNVFRYEIWFILVIYIGMLVLFIWRFVNGCECVTSEEIRELQTKKREKYFGKPEEEKILGQFVRTIEGG